MRFLSLLLFLPVSLGCPGAGAMTGPLAFAQSAAAGAIAFKIDAASCTYAGALPITFMINNAEAGTESLAPGQTSSSYSASGGVTVQARIDNWTSAKFPTPTRLWTLRYSVNVPTGGTVTHTLTC